MNPYPALKMQVKAPKIQVNCSNNGGFIITDKNLCMDKSWSIFIDLYPGFNQFRVVRTRQQIGIFLIGDVRHHQHRINPALGGKGQCSNHFIVQNQIRRHHMDIVPGLVNDIHIDPLPDIFSVQRTVAVRNHKAQFRFGIV